VILDATWRDPAHRRRALDMAEQAHVAVLEIVCRSSVGVAAARAAARPPGPSDADAHIAEVLGGRNDRWTTAHSIDTGQPAAACADRAEQLWRRAV